MAKSSDRSEYIVVRFKPGYRFRRFLILLAFSVVAMAAGFAVGMMQNRYRYLDAEQTSAALKTEMAKLQSSSDQMDQRIVDLQRGHSIDQQSLEQARHTIEGLQTQVNRLKADVTFYRNIMAPSSGNTGLQVQRLDVHSAPGDAHFAYRLVLAQVGDNRDDIHGVVAVNLIGTHDGKKEVMPLRDLSTSVDQLGIPFKFRYFQDIDGELVLPADFSPDEVQVVAQAQGHDSARIERTFQWRKLTETQANVGQK